MMRNVNISARYNNKYKYTDNAAHERATHTQDTFNSRNRANAGLTKMDEAVIVQPIQMLNVNWTAFAMWKMV